MNGYQEFLKEMSDKLCEIKEDDKRVEKIEKEEYVHSMDKLGFLITRMGRLEEVYQICKKYIENLSLA